MKKIDDITILIKTFERKNALKRLLKSIRSNFPQIKIIIADDSKKNYKKEILKQFKDLNIEYFILEFDAGLSSGRNYMLDKTKTKFFVLCDDDFEFDCRADLLLAKKELEENNLDLIGGSVFNIFELNSLINILVTLKKPKRFIDLLRGKEQLSNYNGNISIDEDYKTVTFDIDKGEVDSNTKLLRTDMVNNFFLAKTEKVKEIKWTPDFLKVGEHSIFFYRAKQRGLKIGFLNGFGSKHYPKKTLNYSKYRLRASKLAIRGWKELGVKKYIIIENKKERVIDVEKEFIKNNQKQTL